MPRFITVLARTEDDILRHVMVHLHQFTSIIPWMLNILNVENCAVKRCSSSVTRIMVIHCSFYLKYLSQWVTIKLDSDEILKPWWYDLCVLPSHLNISLIDHWNPSMTKMIWNMLLFRMEWTLLLDIDLIITPVGYIRIHRKQWNCTGLVKIVSRTKFECAVALFVTAMLKTVILIMFVRDLLLATCFFFWKSMKNL